MTHAITLPDDLAENECRQFDLPGDNTGFVVRHRNRFHAYLNRCPHLGIELNWMPDRFLDADRCFIQCATHGALFTIDDGQCIAGPCAGDQLVALELQQCDGQLRITLPDSPDLSR